MSYPDHVYHREREQHCRALAKSASDPDVRRRHEELAELHASRASMYHGYGEATGESARIKFDIREMQSGAAA